MTCHKDAFPTQGKATQIAKRMQNRSYRIGRTVHRIHTYHCHQCGQFHITGNNGDTLNHRSH